MEFIHTAGFIVASNAMAWLFRRMHKSRQPQCIFYVGQIEKLIVYPVKSCKGIETDQAYLMPTGLTLHNNIIRDRHFVVVTEGKDGEPCQVLTQRKLPKMALVKTSFVDSTEASTISVLRFTAPDMPPLDIKLPMEHHAMSGTDDILIARLWGETIYGKDCGPNASSWWRIYLGRDDVHLMHATSDDHLKIVRTSDNMPAEVASRLKINDRTIYADWAPLLIINSTSIDDLNVSLIEDSEDKASFQPVSYNNFRPNILIRSPNSWDEDLFDQLFIGSVSSSAGATSLSGVEAESVINNASIVLRNVKPCTRCVLTTVDPVKGEKRQDGQPLKMLKKIRTNNSLGTSPMFGINAAPDRFGELHVGDHIFASRFNENVYPCN